MKSENQEL